MKPKWSQVGLHLLFWMLCYWLLTQTFSFESKKVTEINGKRQVLIYTDPNYSTFFVLNLITKAILSYGIAFWALPRFFRERNWHFSAFRLIQMICLSIALEVLFNYLWVKIESSYTLGYFLKMTSLNIFLYFLFSIISVAYALGQNWFQTEQLRKQLVKEKLSAELNFLKTQINPHFLFNTLNNLYALAERKQNTDLAQGIAELSNLMRYMLYDCKTRFVPLEKELRFIQSIIEVQQLRIASEDDVLVVLNIEGDPKDKQIAPLILIPFVENAFKHGIDLNHSSFIKIDILIQDSSILFKVVNSNFPQENEHQKHSGIGLENVKRRLELQYKHRYQLKKELKEAYQIELKLEC